MDRVPEVLAHASTSMVSDALDEFGIDGVLVGLTARHPSTGTTSETTVGRALPVRFTPKDGDDAAYRFGGGVGRPLEAVLRSMRAGQFIVFDLGDSPRAACWGGLASQLAAAADVAGVAIWGCCRDVGEIRTGSFPVWSSGVCPRRSRNDFTFGTLGEPITVEGVTVGPGDAVVADETGVVVVPRDREEEVVATVARIIDQERILEAQLTGDRDGIDWDAV